MRIVWLVMIAGLAGCAATTDSDYPGWERTPWGEHRYSKQELLDSQELRDIQARIDGGELPRIQFDFDKATIRPESYPTLNVLADWLLHHPTRKLRILAYTCDIGTVEYNLGLSQRRARAVLEYLVAQGASPSAIRYKGMGMSDPRFPNDSDEHRELNRRVEFYLVARDWDSVR